ncbi:hypothetical protein SSAG_01073 [Streptomyces sp. Mg1]|nr:hypothetical protein SSAG_01073 [Streptomyces sp. Mg1]
MNTAHLIHRAAPLTRIRPFHPDWVPAGGHIPLHTGIYFDVVTIRSELGKQIADRLIQLFDCHPGEIYQRASGSGAVYFVTPPSSVDQFTWPRGALHCGAEKSELVEVPALDSAPDPWSWLSLPTRRREFVDCGTRRPRSCMLVWGPVDGRPLDRRSGVVGERLGWMHGGRFRPR